MEEDATSEPARAPINLSGALAKQAQEANANDSIPQSVTAEASGAGSRASGTQTAQSLIDNPPNLARIRRVLFECKDPIEISLEEFETYWPFIDNVWVKQRTNASKEGHCTTDYYIRDSPAARGETSPQEARARRGPLQLSDQSCPV